MNGSGRHASIQGYVAFLLLTTNRGVYWAKVIQPGECKWAAMVSKPLGRKVSGHWIHWFRFSDPTKQTSAGNGSNGAAQGKKPVFLSQLIDNHLIISVTSPAMIEKN
jgi:hypothetical protein